MFAFAMVFEVLFWGLLLLTFAHPLFMIPLLVVGYFWMTRESGPTVQRFEKPRKRTRYGTNFNQ